LSENWEKYQRKILVLKLTLETVMIANGNTYLLQHSRSILCKFFIFVLRITSYSELSFYTLIVLKQYLSQQQERVKDKIYKDSLLDSYKYTEQLAEDYFSCIEEGRDN
jgi:hypothetical protein